MQLLVDFMRNNRFRFEKKNSQICVYLRMAYLLALGFLLIFKRSPTLFFFQFTDVELRIIWLTSRRHNYIEQLIHLHVLTHDLYSSLAFMTASPSSFLIGSSRRARDERVTLDVNTNTFSIRTHKAKVNQSNSGLISRKGV